jgi:hypothetical protein
MAQWWNDADRGKPKNSEINPSQCHFFNTIMNLRLHTNREICVEQLRDYHVYREGGTSQKLYAAVYIVGLIYSFIIWVILGLLIQSNQYTKLLPVPVGVRLFDETFKL